MRYALLAAVLLKVAVLILVMDPAGLRSFALPKSTMSLATSALLAGCLVATVSLYGTRVLPRTWIHIAVGAYVLACTISWALAEDRLISLIGDAGSFTGLLFVLDMSILYMGVAILARSQRDWSPAIAVLCAAFILTVGYGLAQAIGLDPVQWSSDLGGRTISTFGNSNIFAHFLSTSVGVGLALAVFPLPGRIGPLPHRAVGLVVIAAGAAALAVGGSRGSILGLAAAVCVTGVLVAREWIPWERARRWVLPGVGVGLLAGAFAALATDAPTRLVSALASGGVSDRLLIYDSAIRAWLERPFFGFGPDAFGVAYPTFRQPGSTQTLSLLNETSAHSWPLQAAATTGAVGLIALVALLVFMILVSLKRMPNSASTALVLVPLSAYLANGLVSVSSVAVDWIPWVAAGCVAGLSARSGELSARPASRWRVIAPLAAAALAMLFAYPSLAANRSASLARSAYNQQLPGIAIQAAMEATQLDARRADYWNWLGLGHTLAQDWHRAAQGFKKATELAPHLVTYWANLARAYASDVMSGRKESAEMARAAAAKAVEVDPHDPEAHAVTAEVDLAVGDYQSALAAAMRAIRLWQAEPAYDRLVIGAASRMADTTRARAALLELVAVRDSAETRVALAQIALRRGDLIEARVHATRALTLNPADTNALSILREIGG